MSKNAESAAKLEFEIKQKAKENLVRSKLYKIASLVCMIIALFVVVFLYEALAKGDPVTVIKNPVLLGILFLPFFPPFFLAILSKKKRREAIKMLEPYCETMSASEIQHLKEEEGF